MSTLALAEANSKVESVQTRSLSKMTANRRCYTPRLSCGLCPDVKAAAELAREFGRMVRGKCAEALAGWLDAAAGSRVAEFEGFAAGLRRDQEALWRRSPASRATGRRKGRSTG